MTMEVVIPDLDDEELFAPPPRIHSPTASASGSSAVGSGRPSLDDSSSPYGTMSSAPKPSRGFNDFATSLGGAAGSKSAGNPSFPSKSGTLGGPFRGAALGWHGRSGSATSDSSAGGSSFRFPPSTPSSQNRYEGLGSNGYFAVSPSHQSSNFSFPIVKKGSFASLKAAIKGQSQQSNRDRDALDAWPLTPRDNVRYAAGSDAGESTAGRRTAHPTPRPGIATINTGGFPFGSYGGDASPSTWTNQLSQHARQDSQASGHSRAQASGGTGSASVSGAMARSSRYQHAQQSSYHSDSHHSLGAASSSASSLMQPFSQGNLDLPPVPPLPFVGGDGHGNLAPGTLALESAQPAFLDSKAMASNTSFEQSDMGSPHKWGSSKLREDAVQRRWMPAEDADEASSVDYNQQQPGSGRDLLGEPSEGSNRRLGANGHGHSLGTNPASASLGAEGLGQLPPGIGSNDPRAPSEYALNILMSRFITLTELKVQAALDSLRDAHPEQMSAVNPQIDENLESLYESLSHVAKKNPWPVIESLINWRQLQSESHFDAPERRRPPPEHRPQHTPEGGMRDVEALFFRKRELMILYLLSKAMIVIAKEMGREVLSEAQASYWEDCVFNMLLCCSREGDRERMLPRPVTIMRSSCFEKVSALIGEISRTRFMPISERFVSILESSKEAPAGKTAEEMLVAAIQSMGHLKITIYPLELFEEGAEFVEIISRHFANAHGTRIKTAYAEAFLHLLLPVAKSASAEINHPTWIKGVDNIWPRALSMTVKPRYWAAAYSLSVALLTVSPAEKFLANWYSCIEMGAAKLKDRVNRTIVLNGALRLLWVYLFRCHESSSTTTKRLEAFFRIWFPPNRKAVNPSDSSLEPLIGMVHLVLHRHFDFGRDLVLGFLSHSELGGSTLSLQPDILAGRRMTVAIRAILLTLDSYAQEESPAFPAGADFSRYEFETLPQGCGDELPEGFSFPRPEMAEAQSQFNDLIGKVALICDHQVSDMTIFDERTQIFKSSAATSLAASGDRAILEREGFTWKVHGSAKLLAAYPREHQSHCDLLKACFASWPRCLSSNIAFSSILGILFRAHFSAEPELADASAEALKRIARQRKGGSTAVVSGFMRWIFRQESAFWEIHPKQTLLLPLVERSIRLWIDFLNIWLAELQAQNAAAASDAPGAKGFEMERTSAWAIIDEVEAHAVFLLCSASRSLRKHALEVLRLVSVLDEAFLSPARRAASEAARASGEETDEEPSRVIHLLNLSYRRFIPETDSDLGTVRTGEFTSWKPAPAADALKTIAQSNVVSEQELWQQAIPTLLRMSLDRFPTTIAVFRSYITKRVLGMDHITLVAADIVSRPQVGTVSGSVPGKAQSLLSQTVTTSFSSSSGLATVDDVSQDQMLMAEHWKYYILALCTTTTSTEGSRGTAVGGHHRKSSDAEAGERVIAAKDLFQKMVPFLASSQARFRDAVVTALGNINDNLFGTLLETMQSVSSTLTDDFKVRSVARTGLKRNRRLDRLRTALAQVLQLNAHHLRREENIWDAKIVSTIFTWIKETFGFLNDREIRQDWEFHKLRRCLCGVTEEFFDGITLLGDIDKFFPFDLRLRMFRVFREWHSYTNTSEEGPARLANMLAAAAEQHRDDKAKEQAVIQLRNETQALSYHAGRVMASFCQGSIAVVGGVVPAPMSGSSLEATSLLSWLNHLFSTANKKNHEVARRALRSLLIHNNDNPVLIDSALERCISEPDRSTEGRSFFGVVADAAVDVEAFRMPLHQVLCLGLIKLGHADRGVRRKAFRMLDHVAGDAPSTRPFAAFEVGVTSPLPSVYLRAQRDVSSFLALQHPDLRSAMLSEMACRLPHIDAARRATTLALLPDWLRGMELVPLSPEAMIQRPGLAYLTYMNLCNLLFLTVRYSEAHSFELQEVWSSVAGDTDHMQNVDAVIRFLIEQGLRFRNPEFVVHAKRIVSCLAHTGVGRHMFDELCALVEPGKMIPVPRDDQPPWPDSEHDSLYRTDLDRLLPEPARRQTFSPGQLALFYVGGMAYERGEQLAMYLPALLHAVLMHADHVSSFVRQQAEEILEQLLRCVVSTLPAIVDAQDKVTSRAQVEALFADKVEPRWAHDDADNEALDHFKMPKSLFTTVTTALSIVEAFFPDFREEWGAISLLWAISGPVRHMACRSFQTFRAIRPKVTPSMMADMLGRLSDTISDPNPDIQAFALEILYTLNLVIRTSDVIQQDFLAQSWWATLACLSTVNEEEFAESTSMLDSLLDKLDIGNSEAVAMLKMKCPEGWEGEIGGAQNLVFRGLRSSVTYKASFRLLAKLAKCWDPSLIDHDDASRLGFLFVAAMPWFLQVTDDHFRETSISTQTTKSEHRSKAGVAPVVRPTHGAADPGPSASPLTITETRMVLELASDLADIAERLDVKDLQRVATSIAKKRFRTKDDLIRQAINCIRSRYMSPAGADMAVLLLGITLNDVEWLRRQTMQVLKIFFKVIDTRQGFAFSRLGSELLMPLLRLLSTPLSAEALEVLDEPISIHGGPAANQILRMSLQCGNLPGRMREQVSDASIFGPPDQSGWAVAHPQDLTTRTRINIQAVFKMCELTLDIAPMSSNVNFVVEDGYDVAAGNDGSSYAIPDEAIGVSNPSAEDLALGSGLSEIVNQLHDLSSFFVEENRRTEPPVSAPLHDRRGRFDSIVPRFGSGQSLSRQSSLRNLPYKRHTPLESETSAKDATPAVATSDAPASRSHAQIAKILARSAFGGRMSFYMGRSGSIYRRGESNQPNGGASSNVGFQGGVTPTRSISEPVPVSPEPQMPHKNPTRSASSPTALQQMSKGYFGSQQAERAAYAHEESVDPTSEQRDTQDDEDQQPCAALNGMSTHENPGYGATSAGSGKLSFGLQPTDSTAREATLNEQYSAEPQSSNERSEAEAFDLGEAHAALQELTAGGLGAPFEESPSGRRSRARDANESPSRSRPLMLRRPTDDPYMAKVAASFEPPTPNKTRAVAKGYGERSVSAGSRGYDAGGGSFRSRRSPDHSRFDSVAKSSVSNAKHPGDDN
ncbi:Cell morphogenesis protein PAG1 [Thecaphora frezii]